MGYFSELPNVRYQSPLSHKNSSNDFIFIKNLFRSNKLLDWLSTQTTIFNKFIVADGARPDTVAEEIYGDAELDYVVIISCGITNIRDEWPLSNKELYEFAEDKYGLAGLNAIHHYETLEVRDQNDRLILPAGQLVEHNVSDGRPFKIDGPAARFGGSANKWYSESGGVRTSYTGETISPVVGISNYEYETLKNEEKREIRPLKREFVQMFVNDFKRIMKYDRNTQYVSETLITTENNFVQ
mgnify:FL=1|tara:strand:- start:129 stop:851 length:723 start_codon:yes stop_codon:yes gene_type:complete